MNDICKDCLLKKYYDAFPADADDKTIADYRAAIIAVLENYADKTAPEAAFILDRKTESFFGIKRDFSEEKKFFNALMLAKENEMLYCALAADDPIKRALQYAIFANYIDFATVKNVNTNTLSALLKDSEKQRFNDKTFFRFKKELSSAEKLIYFTDNCGEIVADKVFIRVIKQLNPDIDVLAVLRGRDIYNDATEKDAFQVGLNKICRITGNGGGAPGTVLSEMPETLAKEITAAHLIIAKGQGNYESLCGCGLNIFYAFTCKCKTFTEKFGVPLYGGVFTAEKAE
ncbi:MAG: DUF89 family protein [Clostridia bacterium]|nr:DUF89 family protein [Clostridia bacterium]MBR0189061.1 DUF89 family protein [Clostridia bacterium]